jgi:hypothetical protein
MVLRVAVARGRWLRGVAAAVVALACLAGIGLILRWGLTLYRPIPGDAGPGHPATVTAHRGDTLRLAPKTDDHSATCTLSAAPGESRTFTVYGVDDENNGGWAGSAWWDGTAELDCDRRVDGSVGPRYVLAVEFAALGSVLVLACLAVYCPLRIVGAFD